MELDTAKTDLLLRAFRYLPASKDELSILDAIRRPHDENTVSNLLAFFADSHNPHGVGTLIAQAILSHFDIDTDVTAATAYREVYTNGGNRLDIVIETEGGVVIGIENKIYAGLANPLDDYYTTLRLQYPKRDLLCLVLAPTHLSTGDDRWKSLTYSELWQQTRDLLGHYVSSDSMKWLPTLLSLIEHTEKMSSNQAILSDRDLYIMDNLEDIQAILKARAELDAKVRSRMDTLYSSIVDAIQQSTDLKDSVRCWRYLSYVQVFDFDAHACAVDFDYTLDRISFSWFKRKSRGAEPFNKVRTAFLSTSSANDYKDEGGRFYLIDIPKMEAEMLGDEYISALKDRVLELLTFIAKNLRAAT